MPLPKPLLIPEEISIPHGTGLILVGVFCEVYVILREIERITKPSMFFTVRCCRSTCG